MFKIMKLDKREIHVHRTRQTNRIWDFKAVFVVAPKIHKECRKNFLSNTNISEIA